MTATTARTARPKNCHDCGVKLTRSNYSVREMGDSPLCRDCFDLAGWENTHNDQGHDDLICKCPKVRPLADPTHHKRCPMVDTVPCLVCQGITANAAKEFIATAADTTARSWTSHAACKHDRTPKARAACRKARRSPVVTEPTPAAAPVKAAPRRKATRKDRADAGSIAYD